MRQFGIPNKVRWFLKNLSVPMLLASKIRLTVKNLSIKVFRIKGCCGFHGEPGC